MPNTVIVTIPPDPALLHVLRQLTVGVAARLRLTIDDVDDIKLAVDEAASALLTRLPGSSAILLTLDADGGTMRASVSSEVQTASGRPPSCSVPPMESHHRSRRYRDGRTRQERPAVDRAGQTRSPDADR